MTWMILEGIMLNEIDQAEKGKYCMISLICGISNKWTHRKQGTNWLLPEVGFVRVRKRANVVKMNHSIPRFQGQFYIFFFFFLLCHSWCIFWTLRAKLSTFLNWQGEKIMILVLNNKQVVVKADQSAHGVSRPQEQSFKLFIYSLFIYSYIFGCTGSSLRHMGSSLLHTDLL